MCFPSDTGPNPPMLHRLRAICYPFSSATGSTTTTTVRPPPGYQPSDPPLIVKKHSLHPHALSSFCNMYSSLGFTGVTDTPAAHSIPYVVVDAADAISLCVRALASFSASPQTVTSICCCLFACTHSVNHARHAALCGAMQPLKLIIRDGSQGTGIIAAAAAALSHVIGSSGANVDREPMWQDPSLLDKLLFIVGGMSCPRVAAFRIFLESTNIYARSHSA